MQTEMQQLEENAKIQFYKERVAELDGYIQEIQQNRRVARAWRERTVFLNLTSIAAYWIALGISAWQDLPEEVVTGVQNWWLLIFFFLILREHHFDKKYHDYAGQLDGVLRTLEILYPQGRIEDEGNDRQVKKVKRTSLYKRFKEFFERVGQKRSKEVPA